jgi:uncharacterized protein
MYRISLVVIKAVGNACNLRCSYCYSLDEHPDELRVMSDELLERAMASIATQPKPPICLWSGGEPLLAGRAFFERVLRYQRQVAVSHQFINSIQTNGVMLDDAWINFLRQYNFQVGISWDGYLDNQRLTPADEHTNHLVWQKLEQCRSWGLLIGVVMVAHHLNYQSIPADLVRLYELGIRTILVKPFVGNNSTLSLAPVEYFELMCRTLDVWLAISDASWQIDHMSSYLNTLRGPVASCEFANECHRFLTIEQNGDVTGCDFVWPRPVLGNVLQDDLLAICHSEVYRQWQERVTAVPRECLRCRWFSVCGGGCLHYRPYQKDSGWWGQYRLCQVRQHIWEYYSEQVAKYGWPR